MGRGDHDLELFSCIEPCGIQCQGTRGQTVYEVGKSFGSAQRSWCGKGLAWQVWQGLAWQAWQGLAWQGLGSGLGGHRSELPHGSGPWMCRSGLRACLPCWTTGRPSGAEVRTGALELPVQGATGRPRVALVRGCYCLLRTSLGGCARVSPWNSRPCA